MVWTHFWELQIDSKFIFLKKSFLGVMVLQNHPATKHLGFEARTLGCNHGNKNRYKCNHCLFIFAFNGKAQKHNQICTILWGCQM